MNSDNSTEGETRLQRVLESVGSIYIDDSVDVDFDDELSVELDDGGYAGDPTQEFILPANLAEYLDTTLAPGEEYELQLDTLNHLSYCRRKGSWDRTESFVSETDYPEALARFVHRMVEHAHVTAGRLTEYRGLTGAYARRMEAAFDDEIRVTDLRQDEALIEGLRELAYTGQVAGLDAAPENIQGALSFCGAELDRVRDPEASDDIRDEVASDILQTLWSRMYRPATAERYLRTELSLPFQGHSSELDNEVRDTSDDDDVTPQEAIVRLATLPMAPILYFGRKTGLRESMLQFYTPLPDGPNSIYFLFYPLAFPLFLIWAFVRGTLKLSDNWEPVVSWTTSRWETISTGIKRLGAKAIRLLRQSLQTVVGSLAKITTAIQIQLPGNREVNASTIKDGYVFLWIFPYIVTSYIVGEDRVNTFLNRFDIDISNAALAALYVVVIPPVLSVLYPVYIVSLPLKILAERLGYWGWISRYSLRIKAKITALPVLVWQLPVAFLSLIYAVMAFIFWLWDRVLYALHLLSRRLFTDDWQDDIPETIDTESLQNQLPQNQETRSNGSQEGMSDRSDGISNDFDPQSERKRKSNATKDVNAHQIDSRQPATDSGESDSKSQSNDASNSLETQILTSVETRSGSSRGTVALAEVDYESADETGLDDALGDLSNLDRRTTSELQQLRADRNQRIKSGESTEDVFEAVRERNLDELIRKFFTQFPPKERREVRDKTGHRLDLSAVSESAGGQLPNDGVFQRYRDTETGSRCIGVAIDLSGSMDVFEAKVALAALANAADLLDDNYVAVGFQSSDRSVPLITGPNEPFESKHLSSIDAGGSTPVAAGIRECRRLLKAADADDKTMFVITDGRPNVGLPDGDTPKADTREEIEHCRQDGLTVIGIGIKSSRMGALFGEDAYVEVNDDQFADRLLKIYRNQYLRTSDPLG